LAKRSPVWTAAWLDDTGNPGGKDLGYQAAGSWATFLRQNPSHNTWQSFDGAAALESGSHYWFDEIVIPDGIAAGVRGW
jgi:hypothetical protein